MIFKQGYIVAHQWIDESGAIRKSSRYHGRTSVRQLIPSTYVYWRIKKLHNPSPILIIKSQDNITFTT